MIEDAMWVLHWIGVFAILYVGRLAFGCLWMALEAISAWLTALPAPKNIRVRR